MFTVRLGFPGPFALPSFIVKLKRAFVAILANNDGANVIAGRAKIFSSMGGSFSKIGNFGFRFNDDFRFCFCFDDDNRRFNFFLRGALASSDASSEPSLEILGSVL